jgi:hypothetical protein
VITDILQSAAGWLADQEQRYRIVLYVADSPVNSSWTQLHSGYDTIILAILGYRHGDFQADCVMVVGMGDDPSLGMKTTARKELILLHPDRSIAPGSTREWLKVTDHHTLFEVELRDRNILLGQKISKSYHLVSERLKRILKQVRGFKQCNAHMSQGYEDVKIDQTTVVFT